MLLLGYLALTSVHFQNRHGLGLRQEILWLIPSIDLGHCSRFLMRGLPSTALSLQPCTHMWVKQLLI